MIASYLATVFLLATVRFAHCGKPGKPRWEPLPVCQDCVSPELIIAPGVGFDLTPSYGYVPHQRCLSQFDDLSSL